MSPRSEKQPIYPKHDLHDDTYERKWGSEKVVAHTTKNINVLRPDFDSSRVRPRRAFLRNFSYRIFVRWFSIVRSLDYPVGRQVRQVIDKRLNRRAVQQWAAQNAYTLVFIAVLFVITWILIIAQMLVTVAHG